MKTLRAIWYERRQHAKHFPLPCHFFELMKKALADGHLEFDLMVEAGERRELVNVSPQVAGHVNCFCDVFVCCLAPIGMCGREFG
ncbi:hypothetical protein EP10_003234 [Geobacillus icigianus]|uniref:Uncharacterized protein n=1 Tax=Geobacillus icigianus TaxID=1430331 RepID=A0ABU6BK53_9BACL|nr:hypothetical protein [Geobacillus icigianus]